ncbi:MAG: hypothetical protein ISR58_12245 [Anaerolineales bacterium]|nr:hypothetical protein [Chloroflexota bacterium]MBL6981948.1 hypothetical protein [Anaerolineales bacterium]
MKSNQILLTLTSIVILAACSVTPNAIDLTQNLETLAAENETTSNQENETQEYTSPVDVDSTVATLPILTEANQGLVYGPSQVVLALVEDLPPSATLSVSLVHESQGVLSTAAIESDPSGRAILMHSVRNTPDEEGARPEGQLWFSVHTGSINKEYAFSIAYDKPVPLAPEVCAFYPNSTTLGSTVVFWCGGFEAGATPQYSILVDEEEYLVEMELAVPVGNDGLLIDFFRILPEDPPGVWTVVIDEQEITFPITSP